MYADFIDGPTSNKPPTRFIKIPAKDLVHVPFIIKIPAKDPVQKCQAALIAFMAAGGHWDLHGL